MLGMKMQRGRDDYGVQVFQVKQAAMIIEGLRSVSEAFRFIAMTAVRVGDGNQFCIRNPA